VDEPAPLRAPPERHGQLEGLEARARGARDLAERRAQEPARPLRQHVFGALVLGKVGEIDEHLPVPAQRKATDLDPPPLQRLDLAADEAVRGPGVAV
jgi:hypothetical protein